MLKKYLFPFAIACLLSIPVAQAAMTYNSQFGSSGSGNGQFDVPLGIAIDSSGNIYVVDTGSYYPSPTASGARVQKFNSSGVYVSQFGSEGFDNGQFIFPRGIAFDSSGNIYVVDTNNNRVQKFNSSGVYVSQFGSVDGISGSSNGWFYQPQGIAIDSSGNIYVADTNNNRVQKFNSSGVYVSQFGSVGGANGSGNGQMYGPTGIAIDSSGNIYVVDTYNRRVQKFNSSGVYVSQFGSSGSGNGQFDYPHGIAIDSSGNIYVVDTNNNRVQKFNSSGVYVSQFGSSGSGNGQFDGPQGIAIDSSGNIYVTDSSNNRVQKFVDDITSPIISETTAITTPTGATPNYTFTTDEAGTITYGGSCTSATTSASSGANTITFSALTEGTYSNCTITVTDAASNASNVLVVNTFTVDITAPVITLSGSTPVTVEVGSMYIDAGATASDNIDGDRTANIVTINPVNINTIGTYTVTYNVSDFASNAAMQITRTVNVVDRTGPVHNNLSIITTDEKATITFITNEGATSELSYNTGGRRGKTVIIPISKTITTNHSVVLKDLKACSIYTYTLTKKDVLGNISTSPISFTTKGEKKRGVYQACQRIREGN